MYLELISLRQYGNGSGTGVHTTLCLGSRNTLNAVNAALIFQCTIDIGTTDGKVYLLETTHSTLANTRDAELPTLGVAVALVHLEEVSSKEASLIATCSGTNLHLHVLGIFWVFRNKGYLDFLFQLRLQGFIVSQFLASHLFHFGISLVGQDVFSLLDAVQTGDVALTGIHDIA